MRKLRNVLDFQRRTKLHAEEEELVQFLTDHPDHFLYAERASKDSRRTRIVCAKAEDTPKGWPRAKLTKKTYPPLRRAPAGSTPRKAREVVSESHVFNVIAEITHQALGPNGYPFNGILFCLTTP